MDRSDLAIVIPAYNEEETIAEVIVETRSHGIVIVVNDASTDLTANNAAHAGAIVLNHSRNAGYDAALSTGFKHAASLNCEYVITIDADGQHDSTLIGKYRELLERSVDIVLGVRSRKRLFCEYLFAWVTGFFYGVHDPLCGMKGYRLEMYRRLGHFDSYRSIGTDLILFAVRNGFKFAEIPVPIRERQGRSRFGRGLKANYQVLRSLVLAFTRKRVTVRSRIGLYLPLDPQNASSLSSVRNRLAHFFQTAGQNARAVSFLEDPHKLFRGMGTVQHWRAVFSHDEDFRLWSEAYQKLNRLIVGLPQSISSIVTTYYHECARDLFQSMVILECERRFGSAVAFIVEFDELAVTGAENRTRRTVTLCIAFLRSALSNLAGLLRKRGERPATFLVTVEDNGTRIFLDPALMILKELKQRGQNAVVVSSCDPVITESQAAGIGTVNVATAVSDHLFNLRVDHYRTKVQKFLNTFMQDSPERLFLLRLHFRVPNYLRSIETVMLALRELETRAQVTSILTIYESMPLAVTVGRWARRKGIPWVGFYPILAGYRPDSRYFPASWHLVYGDQMRDKLILEGCDPVAVEAVGTPTFDVALTRNRAADLAYVEKAFPHIGRKLVVVATEAFDVPLVELEPVLRALALMPDVAVVLKLHPRDSVRFFEDLLSSLDMPTNITLVEKCDLLALLHGTDLLIAIVSNVIVTAAILGTPTLVCDFSGKSKVVDFVSEGLCYGCYSPEDISESVRRLLFDPQTRAKALQLFPTGLKRFNGPNDGNSHRRVVSFLQSVSEPSRRSTACRRIPPWNRDGVDHKQLILADSTPPATVQRFAEIARSFRMAWGPGGRVVSTFSSNSEITADIPNVERWTDAYDYDTYYALWTAAYKRTDTAIAGLSREASALLLGFYHEAAEIVFRSIVTQRLLETATVPLLLLAHCSSAAAYDRAGTKVTRLNRRSIPSLLGRAGIRKVKYVLSASRSHSSSNGTGRNDQDRPGNRVLVSIEEGGTNIASTVLEEIGRRGLRATVISSCPCVLEIARSLRLPTRNLAVHSLRLNPWKIAARTNRISAEFTRILRACKSNSVEWVYFHEIQARLSEYVACESNITTTLESIRSSPGVASVLVIDETSRLASVIIHWARSKRIPSLALSPILMGNRPDNNYFPADIHLVYGEHISSHMTRIGVPPDTIHVVGSPTYDSAFFRNCGKDRQIATSILRQWRGEKLVVVGTEALPQPLVELEPVLRTLSEMPGIYVALKVHPGDSLSFYQAFANALPGRAKIDVIKDCDLHALLHAADLLVCVVSNIAITAAVLGTPTLVCDFSEKRRTIDLVGEGLSFACFSHDQIAPMVRQLLFDPASAEQWERMRQSALPKFNGPNDGESHRRIVDFVAASMGKEVWRPEGTR